MKIRESMFYCAAKCGSGYRVKPGQGCDKIRLCTWLPSRGWTCRGCAGVRGSKA